MNYVNFSKNTVRVHLLKNVNFITTMTEAKLLELSIDELFDLLMKSTKELIDLNCDQNAIGYEAKKEEVQLIQRFIIAKRAEFPPLV
jgi:hypothetical protein